VFTTPHFPPFPKFEAQVTSRTLSFKTGPMDSPLIQSFLTVLFSHAVFLVIRLAPTCRAIPHSAKDSICPLHLIPRTLSLSQTRNHFQIVTIFFFRSFTTRFLCYPNSHFFTRSKKYFPAPWWVFFFFLFCFFFWVCLFLGKPLCFLPKPMSSLFCSHLEIPSFLIFPCISPKVLFFCYSDDRSSHCLLFECGFSRLFPCLEKSFLFSL